MRIIERLIELRLFRISTGILPLLLFAAALVYIFIKQQEQMIHSYMLDSAAHVSHSVDRAIGEQVGLLYGLSASHSLEAGDFDSFRENAERLITVHPEWRTVIVTDETKPIFNLRFQPGEPITPLRDPASLKRVWQTKRPYVSDLSHGYVAIRVPVVRNDQILYTLVVPVESRFFLHAAHTYSQKESWGYIIVGSDGIVITSTEGAPAESGQLLPRQFFISDSSTRAVGERLFTSPSPIKASGWQLILYAPESVIRAPFEKARLVVYAGGFLAALLTVVLVLVIGAAWAARHEAIRLQGVVTERVQAAEKLKESEKKFRDLFNKHAAVKLLIDPDSGSIVDANEAAEKFYGWPGEELRRMRIQDINTLSPEQLAVEMEKVKNHQRVHFELCHRVADGSIRDVAVYSSTIDLQGKTLLHSIIHDISARKKVEREQEKLREQLAQAQKMESVGQLAGGVAHDFNNMLSVIIGYSEIAMEKLSPDEPMYGDLEEIHKAALRSTDITRQLLAFARKQTISPRVLDLNETVAGTLKMLHRLIGEDIDLTWSPGPGIWAVNVDPSQIDQILANLCINARDAIAGVGKITIETSNAGFDEAYCVDHFGYVPGEYALLAVSDDGCGMDKETQSRIFEPFFTTKGIGEGTGLGLATVFGIVKQNGGFINVYSEPGKGTTFKVYLPRHTGKTADTAPDSMSLTPHGSGEVILLVEDESTIRELGMKMLQKLGYRVLTADMPSEAIRLAEERGGAIDLLITDVIMPEMNGRELADCLCARYPNIKTLLMSGYTSKVIAHRGGLDDDVNFLPKPFSVHDLALKVQKALIRKD